MATLDALDERRVVVVQGVDLTGGLTHLGDLIVHELLQTHGEDRLLVLEENLVDILAETNRAARDLAKGAHDVFVLIVHKPWRAAVELAVTGRGEMNEGELVNDGLEAVFYGNSSQCFSPVSSRDVP